MPTARLDPKLEALIVHTHDCKCGCRAVRPIELPDDPKAEKDFQAAIIKEAKKLLWDCFHVTNSRRSKAGFPDLVLWRERVVYAELKTETGRLSAAQETILAGLKRAGAEVYIWRPSQWTEILGVLGERKPHDSSQTLVRDTVSSGKKNPLTLGEAERIIGLSDSTISKAIDKGDLPGHRVPFSKHRRVYRADLAAWLVKHGVPVPEELKCI